jgi:dienelactone hydrolase
MRFGWVGIVLAVVFLLALPATAQELLPGYPDRIPLGPMTAKGAVIYSPGLSRANQTVGETPFVIDALQESGWDVFRLQRPGPDEFIDQWISALRGAARRLRDRGYRKLVLAGQSFGGWISLGAAGVGEPFHAVIAFAPAAAGSQRDSPDWAMNAGGLYELAERATADRMLIFLFDGDDFDPGGRGERLKEIVGRRDLTASIVDRPFGLSGHVAGLTRGFARRFAPCIRDYIETVSPAPRFVCGGEAPASTLSDFALPKDLPRVPPPRDTPPALAALAGRWYGVYPVGREILLVISDVEGERVRAVYSFGPLARDVDPENGYTLRRGSFRPESGVLVFSEPQLLSTLECRLGPDGRLDIVWTSRQTGTKQVARLRRLD